MASLSYDLIVLGDDFPGLLAATLCASRGMRVLLAETRNAITSYRLGSEEMPVSPLALIGIGGAACAGVMAELNFEHSLRRKLRDPAIPFQVLTPSLRLEMHLTPDTFSQALQRETGSSGSWIQSCSELKENFDTLLGGEVCLPGRGFWERREIAKILPVLYKAAANWWEQGSEACESEIASLCHLANTRAANASPLSLAHSTSLALSGVPLLAGGAQAWRNLFLEKFLSHSGERRLLVPQHIETSWGKVNGVVSVDDDVRCDHLIAAMPAQDLAALLPEKAGKQVLESHRATIAAYRYTLNFIVDQRAIPEGLAPLAASILDPDAPESGGNFALLSHRAASQPNKRLLCMEGLASVDSAGEPVLGGLREALVRHAEQRMPFLSAHIEAIDSPHEAASGAMSRDLPSTLAPVPVWTSPDATLPGIGALPYASGVKHLWIANEQTLPSLGLEGQFVVARSASTLVCPLSSKSRSATSKPLVLHGTSDT